LDICEYFDKNPRFGPSIIKPDSGRKDIKAWQKALQPTMRCLTRPRYMKTVLPEFMQQDGKDAFVNKHPVKLEKVPPWGI
jgi:glutaredoxin 2